MNLSTLLDQIHEQREEIIRAFIAKYHLEPDECEQIIEYTGNGIIWKVRKRVK